MHQLLADRYPALEHVAKAPRGLGLLEESEEHPDIPQGLERIHARIGAHGERDPARRAEQVAENRDRVTLWIFEEQRRPVGREHAAADLGHLQIRIDLGAYALELGRTLELGQEIS